MALFSRKGPRQLDLPLTGALRVRRGRAVPMATGLSKRYLRGTLAFGRRKASLAYRGGKQLVKKGVGAAYKFVKTRPRTAAAAGLGLLGLMAAAAMARRRKRR